MPFRRRFYKRRPRKYLRKSKTVKRRGVSTRIKTYVKNQIHRNLENKKRMDYGNNNAITVGTASTIVKPLLCAVGQGTDEISRTGNQIKVVKGHIHIYYNLLNYDSVYNPNPMPVWVRVCVIRDMRQTFQATGVSDLTKIFAGNATSLPLQNNMLDMALPINTDHYRVLYNTTFKLGSASNLAAGYPTNTNHPDNSSFTKHVYINWGKWVKKNLKFDDNVSPFYPTNSSLYLFHQAVYADGTTATDTQKLVEFHFVNQQIYEDG